MFLKSGLRGNRKSLTFPERTFLRFLNVLTHVRPLGWGGRDSKGTYTFRGDFSRTKKVSMHRLVKVVKIKKYIFIITKKNIYNMKNIYKKEPNQLN